MKKTVHNKYKGIFKALIICVYVLMFCFVSTTPWPSAKKRELTSMDLIEIGNTSHKYLYSGEEITPDLVISLDGHKLVENKDYSLRCLYNKSAGTAYAVISGLGQYTGERILTYEIYFDDECCDREENYELVMYVNDWFRNLYGRDGTREEIVYWVNRICDGTFNSTELVEYIFADKDFDIFDRSNGSLVARTYYAFLARHPDDDGYNHWCELLDEHKISRHHFMRYIAGSPEFIDKINSFINAED